MGTERRNFFSIFNFNKIPTIIRTIFFNFVNNYTMLNGQISHFDDNIDPLCSFRTTSNIINPQTLFLNCLPISTYLSFIYEIISLGSSRNEQKKLFCLGFNTNNPTFNLFGNLFSALIWNFLYFIRKCRFHLTQELAVEFVLYHFKGCGNCFDWIPAHN